jgi:hypothetical protein
MLPLNALRRFGCLVWIAVRILAALWFGQEGAFFVYQGF